MQAQVTPQRDMMENRNLQILCFSSALCNPDKLSRAHQIGWGWEDVLSCTEHRWPWDSGDRELLCLCHWLVGDLGEKTHFGSQALFCLKCKMRSVMPKTCMNTMELPMHYRSLGWWATERREANIDAPGSFVKGVWGPRWSAESLLRSIHPRRRNT